YDLTLDDIRKRMVKTLRADDDNIFTYLNNGDIKTHFETKERYIKIIENDTTLDYHFVNEILSIPGVISQNGINIVTFVKQDTVIKSELERDRIREDIVIKCQNPENIDNLKNSKDTVFFIQDGKTYHPIYRII